jgi:predicted TIM-barrel fold metal-dependent hydrolase
MEGSDGSMSTQTRRDFVSKVVVSAATGGASLHRSASAQETTSTTRNREWPKIAFEEHFRPSEETVQYPSPKIRKDIAPKLSLDSIAERLQLMDQNGIEVQILSHTADGAQQITDLERVRSFNDDALEVVRRHPGRFRALAALPLWDPVLANAEMDRCLAHEEFVGVIANGFQDKGNTQLWYDTPDYLVFWKHMEQSGVPLYLHPRIPAPSQFTNDYPELRASCLMFHTGVLEQVLRLLVCGIFDHYPDLKMILGHMGEFLPWWIWRFDHRYKVSGWGDYATPAQQERRKAFGFTKESTLDHVMHKNIWITTSGMFTDPNLKFSIDVLGADRILFATDYPYESMSEASDWFDNLAIDAHDKRKIARGNALALIPRLRVK